MGSPGADHGPLQTSFGSGHDGLMDIARIKDDLRRDEGLRLTPYHCTAGKLTIGVGRNLDDLGITAEEADYLLENDIGRVAMELDHNIPWWRGLPAGAQRALVNMAFNLGWPRLSGFTNMLAALEAGDMATAAAEALNSRWAGQVGERADRIAALIRENET